MATITNHEANTLLSKTGTGNGAGSVRTNHVTTPAPFCLQKFLQGELNDLHSAKFWRACLAEFVGTFLLCWYTVAIGLHMEGSSPPGIFQIGLGTGQFITVLVSSLSAASGCHINPAVTLGFVLLREVTVVRAILYTVCQCAGAVTGSLALRQMLHPGLVGTLGVIAPGYAIRDEQAVAMEIMLTGFLMFVVSSLVDKGRTDVTFSVPLTVGLCVGVNILVGGPISGACMNPARALGPAVVMGNYSKQWIYWLGPLTGAGTGAILYDRVFAES